MSVGRRGLLVGGLGMALMTGCNKVTGPIHGPGNPPEPPSREWAFEKKGSIRAALAEMDRRAGGGTRHGLHLTYDRLSVRYRTKQVTWRPDGITVDPKAPTTWPEIDLDAWELTSWPEMVPAFRAATGAEGVHTLDVGEQLVWGLNLGEVSVLTHHGPRGTQVQPDLGRLPSLDYDKDADVATGLRELRGLAGITRVSEFLMHQQGISVDAPWDERFTPGPSAGKGVSLHRGRGKRVHYTHDSVPRTEADGPTTFALTEVDLPLVRRVVKEMRLPSNAWKVVVRKDEGELRYRFTGSGRERITDAKGRQI